MALAGVMYHDNDYNRKNDYNPLIDSMRKILDAAEELKDVGKEVKEISDGLSKKSMEGYMERLDNIETVLYDCLYVTGEDENDDGYPGLALIYETLEKQVENQEKLNKKLELLLTILTQKVMKKDEGDSRATNVEDTGNAGTSAEGSQASGPYAANPAGQGEGGGEGAGAGTEGTEANAETAGKSQGQTGGVNPFGLDRSS